MTTLPVDLGWLILATFILIPALCFIATLEANHAYTRAYRKDMTAREKDVAAREAAVLEAELTLGRVANETARKAWLVYQQAAFDDTEVSMPRLEL